MDARMLKSAAPPSLRVPFTRAEQPEKAREAARKRKTKRDGFRTRDRKKFIYLLNSVIVTMYNRNGNRATL
jgi:hypothetical protein